MTVVLMSYIESFYVLLENHITLIVCNCLFVRADTRNWSDTEARIAWNNYLLSRKLSNHVGILRFTRNRPEHFSQLIIEANTDDVSQLLW